MGEIKIKLGSYIYKIYLEEENRNRLKVYFPYSKDLVDEIKVMEEAKWHGFNKDGTKSDKRYWTIANSQRNWFQLNFLRYLATKNIPNPYDPYDRPIDTSIKPIRNYLLNHQLPGIQFILTRRQCILAWDMGTAKSLTTIEALEQSVNSGLIKNRDYYFNKNGIIWVGPKSALYQVQLEFARWKSFINPLYITYESLKRLINENQWSNNCSPDQLKEIPQAIVFDEIQKIKTPTAQRSQAAKLIADLMRAKYGRECLIIGLSGTPAPKSPADWFHLAETCCPGFLREGSLKAFQNRLAIIKMEETPESSGAYPKLITWLDNEDKCAICGKFKDSFDHDSSFMVEKGYHQFVKSVNEVHLLYKRMHGLVDVKFKKDVLKDLPEKNYRIIRVKPSEAIKRAEKLIIKNSRSTIEALIRTRELSDGFQYVEEIEETGNEICPLCNNRRNEDNLKDEDNLRGLSVIRQPIYIGPEEIPGTERYSLTNLTNHPEWWTYEESVCTYCQGRGVINRKKRVSQEIACPKDDVLKDILDEYEDIGRVVVFGGFAGTLDRIVKLVDKFRWNWIRVDGKGWRSNFGSGKGSGKDSEKELLELFQTPTGKGSILPKLAFIAQPEAGGLGISLTASPVEVFYSNSFSGEARPQAEDRGHRPGMDINKGLTIIDIFHLASDEYVYNNLIKKRNLALLSMGELQQAVEKQETEGIRYL